MCVRISISELFILLHWPVCLYCAVLGQSCSACVYTVLCLVSHVQLFVAPWTVARQTPLSTGFSRPEYWSGLPCPPPGDLPSPGVKPRSPALQADSLPPESPGKPENAGVGSLTLLQGVFPAQESNPRFLHCKQILHQGSPWATREAPCVYTICLH